MIKSNIEEAHSVVADLARFCGWDVSGTFAAGDGAVMTVLTQVGGLAMIQRYDIGIPSRAGGMAGLANIGGHRMGSRFVGGVGTGMTGGTGIGCLSVIKG